MNRETFGFVFCKRIESNLNAIAIKVFIENFSSCNRGHESSLLLTNELTLHLLEIDRTAREQIEQTMNTMAKAEGVTESLKAENQMAWVQQMNNIRNRAEEMILADLIYG